KNVHRRDYAAYLRQGWQIASGGVESACKTVVNQRLCQGGMRWGEEGSDAVAHLRALYRSDADQWEAFWAMAP
ncbi:MAG TPA: ISKra4 family transposase, partial [Gemmataceae bacterium]|nr:ISKra4 family transposase [Gemmataceae bacterium]